MTAGRFLVAVMLALVASAASAKNLQLIDEDSATGFAIFRSGKLTSDDMRELCEQRVAEIVVLSGDAADCEMKYQDSCPSLVIAKEVHQSDKVPLSKPFLDWFDGWVQKAQREGKRIAFRCDCGCHRTGRLAAYYQIKYMHMTVDAAKADMSKYGHWMMFHGSLWPQVDALADYIAGRPCSTDPKYCVRQEE